MPKKKTLILFMMLILTSCGYHLRGSLDLPAGMKVVYMEGGSAQLQEQFKNTMEISSVPIASSPDKAGIIVKVFDEDSQRRVLSLDSGGSANYFELYYRLNYELLDAKNKVISERQSVEIKRDYYNNQLAVIAKENEESVIRDEMYRQAVRTIVNRARVALEESPK